ARLGGQDQHPGGPVQPEPVGDLGGDGLGRDAEEGGAGPAVLEPLAGARDTAAGGGGRWASLRRMISPGPLTRAPPELPGEMAASVWSRSTSDGWLASGISRCRPEMIPAVARFSSPSGRP